MKMWPSTLPLFLSRSDFQLEAVRPKVSFQPDEGLAIERRQGTVDIDDITCTVYLETSPVDQLAIFRRFVDEDLEGGVLPFVYVHPITCEQCIGKIEGDRPYKIAHIDAEVFSATFTLRVTEL